MKYKAVLFDADGMTIVSQKFSDRMQAEQGISWEKMRSFFQGPFQQCKLGKADLKEELAKVVGEWGWTGSVESLMDYWLKTGSELNMSTIDLVGELTVQGIKCYLATNQEKYRAEYLRSELGLGNVFDGLFVSAELGHTKDDPAFFEKALARIGEEGDDVAREEVLFVDHEEKNLAAAASVGLSTHAYHDFDTFREQVLEEQ
jgi:putative hydrolase of the HAD superfamily